MQIPACSVRLIIAGQELAKNRGYTASTAWSLPGLWFSPDTAGPLLTSLGRTDLGRNTNNPAPVLAALGTGGRQRAPVAIG